MSNKASVLFVDSRVPDRATLLAGLAPDVEVFVLDPDVDGLSQMAAVLAGRSDISSIQVLSHGTEGMVQLGSLNLTSANVVTHAADLATIGSALTSDGDILLYGCNTGAGTDGEALIQSLAKLTGADVAASSDLTGAVNQGGNWNLEMQTGPIEAVLPFNAQALADYQGVLATGTALEPTTSGNYDSAQGIALLNNGGHADVYLHQISGDNSYNGAAPQYAAKIVVADASNNIINTLTVSGSDYVLNASVAKLANGGFVVAWSADTSVAHDNTAFGVFYQVYDNAGVAQGTTQPLSSKAGQNVSLTSLADGGFAAAFYTEDQTLTLDIYSESNGILTRTNETTMGGNTIRYSSAEDHDVLYKFMYGAGPSIVQLADKSIVVTDSIYVYYSSTSTPIGDYAFKFDSTGAPANFASGYSSQRLNWSVTVGGTEGGEHAIALSGGGFAVVSLNSYGGTQQYELMLFNSDGTPVNSGDTLTQNGSYDGANAPKTIYAKQIVASVNPGDKAWYVLGPARFSLAESSDGKILVALPKSDMSGVNIYTYTSSGVAVSGPVDSGITVAAGQWIDHPVIVPAANGGFAITYDALSVDSDSGVISGTAYSYGIPYSAIPAPAAPALSLSSSSDTGVLGDGITSVKVPEIKGTGVIDATALLYDTDGTTVLGTAVVDSAGNWTITSSTLADGTHSLTAKQTSGSQTSAASTVLSLKVDSAAPTTPSAPTLDSASDSGTSTTDGITKIDTPVITGTTEANSTVKLYDTDGITLLGTGTANNLGAWSITSNALSLGNHSLMVKQVDVAGNVSNASSALVLSIVAAPVTPTVPTTPTVVDGVPVTSTPVTLPGGGTGTSVTIPVVSDGEGSTVGSPNVADIPLVTANGAALLTSQVPIGTGLTSIGGASLPAGNSLETLIAAIKAQTTTHDAKDQNHLTGDGTDFLTLLSPDVPLLVNTIIVQNTLATSSTPLTLTGTSSTSQHTALVVDTSALASKSSIVLDKVDFAAMVGAASVTGSTAGQILTGDAASQTFILANSTPSQVFAGAGNDQLHYALGSTGTSSGTGTGTASVNNINITHENPLSTATSVYLNAGTGNDVAVFTKAQSAYNIDQHDGYVLVTDKADPTQQITITNTENIMFNDGAVAVQSRDELTMLAGLYNTVLGRQADIGGFDYWGALQSNGASLGTTTVNILGNAESIARGFGLNGDASHDVDVLYQAVFGRAADAAGKAYWVNALNNGSTIADVANGFVTSVEMTGHKLATTDWDLHF